MFGRKLTQLFLISCAILIGSSHAGDSASVVTQNSIVGDSSLVKEELFAIDDTLFTEHAKLNASKDSILSTSIDSSLGALLSKPDPKKIVQQKRVKKPNVLLSLIVRRIKSAQIKERLFKAVQFSLRYLLLLISAIVIVFTWFYVWQRLEKKRFMTTTRLSIMDKEVQKTCRYIEKNFSDAALSVTKIAFDLVTGEAFMQLLFKKELGITVEEFIAQVRINRAKIYCDKNRHVSVEELATLCGFTTSIEFDEMFQKITGISFEKYQQAIVSGDN